MSEKNHSHDHPHDEPALSRRWVYTTVAGNGVVGTAEAATAGTNTLSVATDMFHNLGMDVPTYILQGVNVLRPGMSEKIKKRFRLLTHCAISAMSLGASAKVGIDLFGGHEHEQHPATLYAAMGSVALNGLLLARWRRSIKRKKARGQEITHDEKDIGKHLWGVDIPAATIALGGAALQKYGFEAVEQSLAGAANLWGAWLFRPTKKNLSHSCSHHSHEHTHTHHDTPLKEELRELPLENTFIEQPEPLPASTPKNDAIWMAHDAFGTYDSYNFADIFQKCDKFAEKPFSPYDTAMNKETL